MHLIPFTPDHILAIDTPLLATYSRDDIYSAAKDHAVRGECYTLSGDGLIVACGGVDVMWEGVGEAWTILSRHIVRYKKSLHRTTRECLEDIIDCNHLHRVQAHVLSTDATAIRWIERLGFHREGLCGRYGPHREDYLLYARLT